MDIEKLRSYCLNKPGVTEELPFGPETLVFKVAGKVFCLAGIDSRPLTFNVKCDPEIAMELREKYDAVQPGFHMNKKHWNTIIVDGRLKLAQLYSFIDMSYDLVAPKIKKVKKKA